MKSFCIHDTKACQSGSLQKPFSICRQFSWIQHQICFPKKIYENFKCAITLENKQLSIQELISMTKSGSCVLQVDSVDISGDNRPIYRSIIDRLSVDSRSIVDRLSIGQVQVHLLTISLTRKQAKKECEVFSIYVPIW